MGLWWEGCNWLFAFASTAGTSLQTVCQLCRHNWSVGCIASNFQLMQFLGIGRVALVDGPKNKKVAPHLVLWGNTRSSHLMHSESNSHSSHYYLGSSLTTSCGDVVHVDQHAIAHSDGNDKAGKTYCMNFCMLIIAQYRIGRIKEILVSTNPAHNVEFIVLQLFVFAPSLHPQLHLPCLTWLEEEVVVHPKVHHS